MAFRWQGDHGPTMNAGLVALYLVWGSGPVLLRNPVFFLFLVGGGGSPLDPRMSLSTLEHKP